MMAVIFPGMGLMFVIIAILILLLFVSAIVGLILICSGVFSTNEIPLSRRLMHAILGLCLLTPPVFCVFGKSTVLAASSPQLRERVTVGMTAAEVEDVLGNPGQRVSYDDGSGHWYYGLDWWGIEFMMVCFGRDGRVISVDIVD